MVFKNKEEYLNYLDKWEVLGMALEDGTLKVKLDCQKELGDVILTLIACINDLTEKIEKNR